MGAGIRVQVHGGSQHQGEVRNEELALESAWCLPPSPNQVRLALACRGQCVVKSAKLGACVRFIKYTTNSYIPWQPGYLHHHHHQLKKQLGSQPILSVLTHGYVCC